MDFALSFGLPFGMFQKAGGATFPFLGPQILAQSPQLAALDFTAQFLTFGSPGERGPFGMVEEAKETNRLKS